MKRALKWIIIICCTVVIGWQAFQYNHRLNFVPDEMHVWRILSANEKSWGFGPGGNETGFIMYALPDEIAEKVHSQGIVYLSSFTSARLGKPHGWQGKYEEWHSTPILKNNDRWFRIPASDDVTQEPALSNYLNQYGFCIPIPTEMEAAFNKAITTPGNFYAYGRMGMILVAPAIRKVFYVYAG